MAGQAGFRTMTVSGLINCLKPPERRFYLMRRQRRYMDAFDYVNFLNGVKEWNMETASFQ